jgi:hypothetical protein
MKQYKASIKITKDLDKLPTDRRKRPYPDLRRKGWDCTTWSEYYTKYHELAKRNIELYAQEVFSNASKVRSRLLRG